MVIAISDSYIPIHILIYVHGSSISNFYTSKMINGHVKVLIYPLSTYIPSWQRLFAPCKTAGFNVFHVDEDDNNTFSCTIQKNFLI